MDHLTYFTQIFCEKGINCLLGEEMYFGPKLRVKFGEKCREVFVVYWVESILCPSR